MATISNTPRPGYVWDSTDNVWYPIGTGPHTHADYITSGSAINPTIVDAKGDIIAATAADTVARLAVGSNDQVLTADSSTATGLKWATASSGDFVRITTSSFSASSGVEIDSCFSSTYDNYRILFNVTALASSPNSLNLRFRTGGSTNTTSNYGSAFRYTPYGGGSGGWGGSSLSNTSAYLADYSNYQAVTVFDIFNPFASQKTHVLYLHNLASGYVFNGGALFDSTTSFDGIRLYPDTGTITGTVSVYGYKKA